MNKQNYKYWYILYHQRTWWTQYQLWQGGITNILVIYTIISKHLPLIQVEVPLLYFFFTVPRSITPPPLPLSELWVLVCLSDTIYFCYMYICHIQQYNHKHMHQKAFWPIILVALVFLKVGHLHAKLPWLSIVLSIASVFLNDIFSILSIIQILVFPYQLL